MNTCSTNAAFRAVFKVFITLSAKICASLLCLSTASADISRLDTFNYLMTSQKRPLVASEFVKLHKGLARIGYGNSSSKSYFYDFSISPNFRYETNVNGGNPNKPLQLGRAVFLGDPELAKISSTVMDINGLFNMRFITTPGSYLSLNTHLQHTQSLETHHTANASSIGGCYYQLIATWKYFDFCNSYSSSEKEITQNKQQISSIALTNIYETSENNSLMISIGSTLQHQQNFEQNQYFFRINSIGYSGYNPSLGVTLGEPKTGELVLRESISGSLLLPIMQSSKVKLSAEISNFSGGKILGFNRNEQKLKFQFDVPITQKMSVAIGYFKNDSNIDYFDNEGPLLSVTFLNF